MNATYAGPLAGIGLTLPPADVHNAVIVLLVVLALSYGCLFWAVRRAAHDRRMP
jgi:hypothetical protein